MTTFAVQVKNQGYDFPSCFSVHGLQSLGLSRGRTLSKKWERAVRLALPALQLWFNGKFEFSYPRQRAGNCTFLFGPQIAMACSSRTSTGSPKCWASTQGICPEGDQSWCWYPTCAYFLNSILLGHRVRSGVPSEKQEPKK